MAGAVLVGPSGPALGQSVVAATIRNATPVPVGLSAPAGCLGTPPAPALAAGGSAAAAIVSPHATANGCSVRAARPDTMRSCTWILSRLRGSPAGPWAYPAVRTTPSGSGVTCLSAIGAVGPNGDWSVALTIAP
ncbi:hypothetical protein M446_4852 [Methylobacterium sp. 4-46]|uniref:hypothetical protein n=1 Tax=unclassified Methylobacterium TaxID=2615210 RepID=UPI000165CDC6|nr:MULTISPECIES: hypothetical protein [Methylobacterium]ACA19181.1 hypothetical protein M446_4852 [Methylobacterium sp. 4-46]WFT78389.1 hypothetical protein QA634_24390 [Methylobacterium nodulans]